MIRIPFEVLSALQKLEDWGFEAHIVGGCVRDLLLRREPEDWDIATNAKPEEIQKIFPRSFYENRFFTVTVLTESKDPKAREIEITSYRSEFRYSDRRRPEEIRYAKSIEEDLSRRDFTVNAIALRPSPKGKIELSKLQDEDIKYTLVDPFGGQEDLERKILKAVGNPAERFQEDALRMLRAVRFFAVLDFSIEEETKDAIKKHALLLKEISQERIRDELAKIVLSEMAAEGVEVLRELELLRFIIPELEEGYGVGQNKHHIYTVWEHNLLSLKYAAKMKWSLEVRLASLLHDVAKPRVKRGEGPNCTFYNHEVVGAKMTRQILSRLKFPTKTADKVVKFVRYHLFYYNAGEVTDSSVRRLIRKVEVQDMEDLVRVRMADRIGSGVLKAEPYKLRHLKYVVEKVSRDPISAKMLEMNGDDIMEILGLSPGPKVGQVLNVLLAEVLENPKKNDKPYLEKRVRELNALSDERLRELASQAKNQIEEIETKRDEMTKQKYWVT